MEFTEWIEQTADAIDAELHRIAVIEIDAELTRLAVEGIKRQRLHQIPETQPFVHPTQPLEKSDSDCE